MSGTWLGRVAFGIYLVVSGALRKNPERKNLESQKRDNPECKNPENDKI